MPCIFDELEWHDSQIVSIVIDRSPSRETNVITILVHWPDDTTNYVDFLDCRQADFYLNLNYAGPESVSTAWTTRESAGMKALRETWAKVGADLGELTAYELETSTSGSSVAAK